MKRLLVAAAAGLGALIVAGGVLYQFFDMRVVLDGAGTPRLQFVDDPRTQADRIARDRAHQRADPAVPAAAETPTPATESTSGTAAAPADVATTGASSAQAMPSADRPVRAEGTPGSGNGEWTDFRGPRRDGRWRGEALFTAWPSAGLTPMWKQPVGGGYASFAIAGNRAFTIEQRGTQEVVAAYDVASGRELWTNAWDGAFKEFMGGDGPRATPTWHDGRLYALGALGEFRALDESTGRVLWRVNILDDNGASNLQWAMAASPLVVDDTIVVLPGGSGGRSVAAYDIATGRRRWSALDDKQAYVSPMLVTLAGRRQLLVMSASRVMGLTPDRGEVLWEYPWVTEYDINASQPLMVDDTRFMISSGYGKGAALLQVSTAGDRQAVRAVWTSNRLKNRFNSSVLHQGHIYGFDEAILACIDVETGDLKWKGGRYGYGQLMLANDHLIVVTEDGDIALVRATPEKHDEVARFAALDGKTWNHPAIDHGRLLVRNLKEMAAYDLRVR